MEETKEVQNDNVTYKPEVFQTIHNTFFHHVASAGYPIATGDCLLHYMRSGKKEPQSMTPQSFYTHFQKALCAVNLLDHCYEKEFNNDKAKISFFTHSPRTTSTTTRSMVNVILTQTLSKISTIFSTAIMMLTRQRKTIIPMIIVTIRTHCLGGTTLLSHHVTMPKMQLTLHPPALPKPACLLRPML